MLKPKYKFGGRPVFTFSLPRGKFAPLLPRQLRHWYDILYCRGSQPFSGHVHLWHSDRWACTPSAFQKLSMYPFNISTDEHVPLKFVMTIYLIMLNHRYNKK